MLRVPCGTLCTVRRSTPVHKLAPCLPRCQRRSAVSISASAEPQAPSKPASKSPVEYVDDNEFNISKVSFGSILTPIGLGLLVWGFGAYTTLLPGADLSSLFLIYGFPISLLGFALSYAQLRPVPCKTTKEAFALRDSQMTDIQKQIREDVTRFRYGDEQHLEEALDRIFKPNRPGGIARKLLPVLTGIREEVSEEGAYTLVLEFSSSLDTDKWEVFRPKIQSFFGPGIVAALAKTEAGMDVALVCDGSGAGRTGKDKKDVLPPLMPGLKARQQE
ncbi:hypothetical protein VOLCADRAFT_108512 [Volvox carteri f. nagariensis]|uniref:Thylakoid membrane protein n=1 Tax=Volvox carteri f. nagariensis TaxID=3068 RepID=D8UKJ7_VOLCA|nr:uncharacterized protein VOLCADRAFT_108512 [Volvox carteri f. nagariensis]EFJ39742.1 hypothetical protein VOLCADRAFT_108512 [Volvox carteri f. nagariensis]|eukprot:XP_002959180.1 hypothetical protein VOLCADRAFT_108512 [Volvox carteri f. nagariensis]